MSAHHDRPPGTHRAELAVRTYGRMLRALPTDLRMSFGEEAERLFAELYREARLERGRAAAARLWAWSMWRLALCAIKARADAMSNGPERGTGPNSGRGGEIMAGLTQDLRYAARTLRKHPGFALSAILILAAGIGATTTIFSVVDTVVLRSLPYPAAGRLVHFDEGAHSYPLFRAWQELESMEGVAAARDHDVDLTGEGAPQRLPAAAVSERFFEMLGASPRLGRLFTASEHPSTADRSRSWAFSPRTSCPRTSRPGAEWTSGSRSTTEAWKTVRRATPARTAVRTTAAPSTAEGSTPGRASMAAATMRAAWTRVPRPTADSTCPLGSRSRARSCFAGARKRA